MTSGTDPRPATGVDALPLCLGHSGPPVTDLRHRLAKAGVIIVPGPDFDTVTDRAVRDFQASRGIRVDGICGPQTWTSLVEADWRLGDRLLFERQPMLRGDDVSELQTRLGSLGFLNDRIDGFLGPLTRSALEDFQRNCGLTVDGICGPATINELIRLGRGTPSLVKAGIVEHAKLRNRSRDLTDMNILLGDLGGANTLVGSVERVLRRAGAAVSVINHPDGSVHAQRANDLETGLYLGLSIGVNPSCSYYSTPGFTSHGGQRLAVVMAESLSQPGALAATVPVHGMRLSVLRETRMPAVVCEVGPARTAVEQTPVLAELMGTCVRAWVVDPLAVTL